MDRAPFHRPPERPASQNHTAPPPASHPSQFPPPTAQPPMQIPFSDPFHSNRDPFLAGAGRRDSLGLSSRAWPPPQGNLNAPPSSSHHHHLHHHHHHHHPPPQTAQHQLSPPSLPAAHAHGHPQSLHPPPPPPPPANGLGMASSYDPTRRRSLGPSGSPPQFARGPLDSLPPPSFPARNMPPPSPPQNAHPPPMHHGPGPRGPPSASPFPGVRELTSSHRPGMSISAILGGGDERRPVGSPHSSAVAPASTPKSMRPPSPARARSSSMREGNDRSMNRYSPQRAGLFGEPPRTAAEPRREGIFGSPQFRREPGYGFRAYQGPMQEQSPRLNGHGAPVRPISQPVEIGGPRNVEEMAPREGPPDMRQGTFRHYGEPQPPPRHEAAYRPDRSPFVNGATSHPQGRGIFTSPHTEYESRQAAMRYPGSFGSTMREEHGPSYRPVFPPTSHPAAAADLARESIEGRAHDMRRQLSRPSPPPSDLNRHDRIGNGAGERPMTFDEHQRLEILQREQQRKDSERSFHRSLLNISPELDRKGRNSPLPQAVQGAQPKHNRPGGNNPGIKNEFGRMFSGLGSGVGSTPNPLHPLNEASTPSRQSPSRQMDRGDIARPAVGEIDERRGAVKAGGRKNGRRSRDDGDQMDRDSRNTPDLQRAQKRTKTSHPHHHHHHVHPHHHHHHHHFESNEAPPAQAFNTIRFPSNPLSHANVQAHTHHHHHAHPGHHHHHTPRATAPAPPARKPSTTVLSKSVIDQCVGKARKHLGSALYSTELSLPSPTAASFDSKLKFSSKMKPIPVFHGAENSVFTVRVPRYYLTPSESSPEEHTLETICSRRQLWGTEIYTDDSDVVAAAVHSGWLKGDFGEFNDALRELCDSKSEQNGDTNGSGEAPLTLNERPTKPIVAPEGFDAHITLLILPPLEFYASTTQHHIRSREWNKTHDGMSYMINSIEFVDEGPSNRFVERSAAARKNRIAMEEASRKEAAAGLLMFASGGPSVRVGA